MCDKCLESCASEIYAICEDMGNNYTSGWPNKEYVLGILSRWNFNCILKGDVE